MCGWERIILFSRGNAVTKAWLKPLPIKFKFESAFSSQCLTNDIYSHKAHLINVFFFLEKLIWKSLISLKVRLRWDWNVLDMWLALVNSVHYVSVRLQKQKILTIEHVQSVTQNNTGDHATRDRSRVGLIGFQLLILYKYKIDNNWKTKNCTKKLWIQ